jgi:hypothetical protein
MKQYSQINLYFNFLILLTLVQPYAKVHLILTIFANDEKYQEFLHYCTYRPW